MRPFRKNKSVYENIVGREGITEVVEGLSFGEDMQLMGSLQSKGLGPVMDITQTPKDQGQNVSRS